MSSARPVRPASAPPAARQARIGAFGGFHPQNTQPRFSSRLLPRASPSSELLPIFPLGMVALPASQCPLHIFEARYRVLFRYVSGSDQGRLAALARSLARSLAYTDIVLAHACSPTPFLPSFLPHRQHVAGRGRGYRPRAGLRRQAVEGHSAIWHGILRPASRRPGIDRDGAGNP